VVLTFFVNQMVDNVMMWECFSILEKCRGLLDDPFSSSYGMMDQKNRLDRPGIDNQVNRTCRASEYGKHFLLHQIAK
jgi:hypothetical protein